MDTAKMYVKGDNSRDPHVSGKGIGGGQMLLRKRRQGLLEGI